MMAITAITPACRKAPLISRPASCIVTGAPVASGATVRIAATKRSSTARSRASPRGNTSTRARPSGAIQLSRNSGGSSARVTGLACSVSRNMSIRWISPASSTSRNAGTMRRAARVASASARASRPAGLCGAVGGGFQRVAAGADRLHHVRIAGRRQGRVRKQGRAEQQREVGDDRAVSCPGPRG